MSFATLYDHIVQLDSVLTGKDISRTSQTARNQAHVLQDVIRLIENREIYYLSDGGYSRVYFADDGELQLTSNSLDAVKARWQTDEAQAAVRQFRDAVTVLYEQAVIAASDSGTKNGFPCT